MAFNSFSGNRTSGAFVYALTDNGVVIYIGVTWHLRARYKCHFAEMLCQDYIYNMRIAGRYPGIEIIGMFDSMKEAEIAEHAAIRALSYVGNKLLNDHQNPKENILRHPRMNKGIKPKNMPSNLLDEMIKTALHKYNDFRKHKTRIWQERYL